MNKNIVLLVILFFLLLLMPIVSANDNVTQENSWYVEVRSDDGDGSTDNPFNSLNSALIKANDNDTIYLGNGLYSGKYNNDLEISANNLKIIGNEKTVISGNGYGSFFKITGNNITITGLTFTNGHGGIVVTKEASLNILNSKFITNTGINGACIDNNGNLTITNCYFSNNLAMKDAGCISTVNNGYTAIINSIFELNIAKRNGGALKVNNSNLDIFNCSFVNNNVLGNDNYGGAIYQWTGTTRIYNSSFINNSAGECGGAVYTNGKNNYGIFECYGCEYLNNTSPEGGAVYIRSTDGQITYSAFVNNSNTIYLENFVEKMNLNGNWWGNNNPNFAILLNSRSYSIKNYTTVELNVKHDSKVNTNVGINLKWSNLVPQRNILINSNGGNIIGNIFKTSSSGKYNITVIVDNQVLNTTINIIQNAFLTLNDLDMFYRDGSKVIANLSDELGKPIINETIFFNINGKIYNRTTNSEGLAFLTINLQPNEYWVYVTYNGNFIYNPLETNEKINVKSTIEANNLVKMYQNNTPFTTTFLNIADVNVTFNINGVMYTRLANFNGVSKLNINLRPGNYILTAINPINGEQRSFNITVKSLIESNNLTKYFQNNSKFEAKIYNKDGTLAINKKVIFNINGVFYTRITTDKGLVNLNINLRHGNYMISTTYNGLTVGNIVNILPTLETNDIYMFYKDGSKFSAKTLNKQGKPLANQTVIFNVNGVFYSKISDGNGFANLNINLNKGKYIITSMWNNYQVGNTILIS